MDENIQITQRRRVQGTFVWIFLLIETKQKICFQVEFVMCVLKGLDIPRKNEPLLRWAEKGLFGSWCRPSLASGSLGGVGSCTRGGSDGQEQMSLLATHMTLREKTSVCENARRVSGWSLS